MFLLLCCISDRIACKPTPQKTGNPRKTGKKVTKPKLVKNNLEQKAFLPPVKPTCQMKDKIKCEKICFLNMCKMVCIKIGKVKVCGTMI